AIDAVVEHDDREMARPLNADGGERAHPHQHFAVAGDDRDVPLRLRQRQAETDHGGAAPGAPGREGAGGRAERGQVPAASTAAAMRSTPNTCCTARSAAPSTSSALRTR